MVTVPSNRRYELDHKIRIQPRQTPQPIDQIWLSQSQHRIPNTSRPKG